MTGWHGLTDDSPPPSETLPWVFCSRAGSLQHCTGILGGSLSAPHHGIQLQGCYHPTWAPAKIDLRSLRLLRRRSALKVLYFHLPAVDQIQKLYETSAFLIVGSECGVFSLLVRKKSSTLSQPCIYFYSGLWAWGKPRVLSRLLELIHPMFLRIHFVKYSFTLKIYCWEKGNVTGLTWHRLAKKKPQPTFIFSMKFLSLDGGVSSRSSLSLQQKGNAFIRTNYWETTRVHFQSSTTSQSS